MQLTAIGMPPSQNTASRHQILLAMKCTIILMLAACLQVSASGYSQTISVKLREVPFEKALKEIAKKSGHGLFYLQEQIKGSKPVSIVKEKTDVRQVLDELFNEQPLKYEITNKTIVVSPKEEKKASLVLTDDLSPRLDPIPISPIDIKGTVKDETGKPVEGAAVLVKGNNKGTVTNAEGEWELKGVDDEATLVITHVNIETIEIKINGRTDLATIRVKTSVKPLDETIVQAYGTTTQRLNTGNIVKIKGEEIAKQPVSNFLAALEGRVPGMLITQTSGVPGSSFRVEIRGRSSLDLNLSQNNPLFIIDGVPFEPGNLPTNQFTSAANTPRATNLGGLSPLNTISPTDIESIEVLKDADATAIYGSRGANGVILITTKKGKLGKTTIVANLYTSWSNVTRTMGMMNTQDYIRMRREAIANDGFVPQVTNGPFSNGYAPDLLIWDTTRFVDHKKLVIGNTAAAVDASITLSGGTSNSQFLISSSYHSESNVFSRDLSDKRGAVRVNINNSTQDKKFVTIFDGYYSSDKNQLIQQDLTQYINLPPNFLMYDSTGKPNWIQNGIPINNIGFSFGSLPSAELLKRYTSSNDNLQGNLQLIYHIIRGMIFRTNLGYNKFTSDEVSVSPKASLHPLTNGFGASNFGKGISRNWIAEPQIEYTNQVGKGKLNILIGSTWQERKTKSEKIEATNYTNDLLLTSLNAAGQIRVTNNHSLYRYTALFGRSNFNWADKYIINFSIRRDGSSRFGPGKQFANFSSIGTAWIFSKEPFMQKALPFLSYGKIRGSFGTTGNDQIGDYRFLNLWSSSFTPYGGTPGLVPSNLYNPNFEWEINKKLEAAIELGFIKDRILFSLAYYRNRSNNQLINYKLPSQTGFETIVKNFPALVQNNGLELTMSSKIISTKNVKWTSSFNITIPKNKLISFPDLANSSYSSTYVEGQPLSILRRYKYLGIDPSTGIYEVQDVNGDGIINFLDAQFLGNTDPKFFGGFQNTINFKGIELGFFFEFRKQIGKNYLSNITGTLSPGLAANQPTVVFERWKKPGDISSVQKFTSSFSGPAADAAFFLNSSDGIFTDASFIRLKNLSLSYSLPNKLVKKFRLQDTRIFMQAQNLFVITKYLGSDPETQDILVLPPLKTVAIGINLNF